MRRYSSQLLLAISVALLAWRCIAAVYQKLGHPGATLDDAFIHFQYARAIAEGHPLRYQAGAPISTGATSVLWPLVLAPFWLVGFRDLAILWPAWALSFVTLALLAREAFAMTLPLAGRTAAIGAGALVLAFGGHVWCAASGMEVVPFAWALVRALRLASDRVEGNQAPTLVRELVAFATIAFLFRPEGALACAAATAALFATARSRRDRLVALLPLAAPIVTALVLLALTGHASTSTAQVKLLANDPYHGREAVLYNLRLFFGTLLNGEIWSAEFLPPWGAPIAMLGLVATGVLGWRTKKPWRAAFVIALALSMTAPCFYVTFLWNRLRYLWPFATGWLIGLACLARLAGDLMSRVHRSWIVATPVLCGVFVGLFAARLEGVITDVAGSASGIDRQHVTLGRWAKAALPADARIGVNDTGAIAYFSERRTFDVVGLTTPGEAKYWVAGAAPRFEHYERMGASLLPTHFIVYPEWLACDACLGTALEEATVTDATILGGQTMRAYVADWSLLGSAEAPWSTKDHPVDTLDVGDLESEAEHAYELLGAHEGETIVRSASPPGAEERTVADGGRTNRLHERFVVRGAAKRGIVRVEAPFGSHMRVGGVSVDVPAGGWTEVAFDLEMKTATVELSFEPAVAVYHYWFFSSRPE